MFPGAYELLKAAKKHETCTICQVPSQSKFIAKYFPYKESEILLFEAVYGSRVTTQTTMTENFLELSSTTEDLLLTVLTSTSCCTSLHSISHEVSVSRPTNYVYGIFKYRDVIWIVMELSFMLLCHLWQLISSWCSLMMNLCSRHVITIHKMAVD